MSIKLKLLTCATLIVVVSSSSVYASSVTRDGYRNSNTNTDNQGVRASNSAMPSQTKFNPVVSPRQTIKIPDSVTQTQTSRPEMTTGDVIKTPIIRPSVEIITTKPTKGAGRPGGGILIPTPPVVGGSNLPGGGSGGCPIAESTGTLPVDAKKASEITIKIGTFEVSASSVISNSSELSPCSSQTQNNIYNSIFASSKVFIKTLFGVPDAYADGEVYSGIINLVVTTSMGGNRYKTGGIKVNGYSQQGALWLANIVNLPEKEFTVPAGTPVENIQNLAAVHTGVGFPGYMYYVAHFVNQ